jgi:hypothetical protein
VTEVEPEKQRVDMRSERGPSMHSGPSGIDLVVA